MRCFKSVLAGQNLLKCCERYIYVLYAAQASKPVHPTNLLLRDLGPAEWEPEDVVEVGGDVHVEAARQVPRLDDPVVVQAEPRATLEVRHERRDLRLQVVRHRQPLGRRTPVRKKII